MCGFAASNGHLHVLRWAIYHGCPCPLMAMHMAGPFGAEAHALYA